MNTDKALRGAQNDPGTTSVASHAAKSKRHTAALALRPASDADLELLYLVYAGTRQEELAVTGWSDKEKEIFLRMQFGLQHDFYRKNYPKATFEVIVVDGIPAGRLYREERAGDIRIIDIALLPAFRGRGAGSQIMADLAGKADTRMLSLSLHVERNNPVLYYYQRLGFRTVADRGVYFFMERPPLQAAQQGMPTAGGVS